MKKLSQQQLRKVELECICKLETTLVGGIHGPPRNKIYC